jgi:hypothetical protein
VLEVEREDLVCAKGVAGVKGDSQVSRLSSSSK